MTGKIVGAFVVVGAVGRVVGGGHVDRPVAEHDPDGLRVPRGLAESLVHLRRVLGGDRDRVRVSAVGEDGQLPRKAGGEVVNRHVGIFPGFGADLGVPVGIADAGRADGGHVGRGGGSDDGRRAAAVDGAAGLVQLLRGGGAHDAVRLQAVGPLEGDQRQTGLVAELAVRLAGQVAQSDQPVLHGLDRLAGSALVQGDVGNRVGNGSAVRGAVAQLGLRSRAHDAVRTQAVGLLEGFHRTAGGGTELAVGGTGQIAQRDQLVLKGLHLHAFTAVAQRGRLGGRDHVGACGVGPLGRVAVQHGLGVVARLAVGRQAVRLLEGPYCGDVVRQVDAVLTGGIVAQLLQTDLQTLYVRALTACLDGDAVFLRDGRIGGNGGLVRSGHGGGGRHRVDRVRRKQHRPGLYAAYAVRVQTVGFLELLERFDAVVVKGAGHFAGQVAQLGQTGLHQLHVVALVAGANHILGHFGHGSGRGSHGHGSVQRPSAVKKILIGGGKGTVHHQTVLAFKFLDGGYGQRVAYAGGSLGVVAQLLQPGLSLGDDLALAVELDDRAHDGRNGLDVLSVAVHVLGGAFVNQQLQLRVRLSGLGQAVAFLKQFDGLLGFRTELAVRVALRKVLQLDQRLLQRRDHRAGIAAFEQGVGLGAGLGRGRRHGRRRGNVGQIHILGVHIALLAVVFHPGKVALHAEHRHKAVDGNGAVHVGGAARLFAQLHIPQRGGVVGIGRHRQRRGMHQASVRLGVRAGIGAVDVFDEGIALLAVKLDLVIITGFADDRHRIAHLDPFEDGGGAVGPLAQIHIGHTGGLIGLEGFAGRQRRSQGRKRQQGGQKEGQPAPDANLLCHSRFLQRQILSCVWKICPARAFLRDAQGRTRAFQPILYEKLLHMSRTNVIFL